METVRKSITFTGQQDDWIKLRVKKGILPMTINSLVCWQKLKVDFSVATVYIKLLPWS